MKKLTSLVLLSGCIILMNSCMQNGKDKATSDPLAANIDSSFSPAKDFFSYANNGWFKNHPIPASETSNGLWRMIQDTLNDDIRKICESSASANAEKGSNKQKIGDFFYAGMDTLGIEKAGITPLADELKAIDAINDINSFMKETAHLHVIGANPAYSFYINADDKISSRNAIFLWQGGLGLPERNYYFDTDARTANIRNEYAKHLKAMFRLSGDDEAKASKEGESVMKMETALANSSRKIEDLRDPYKNYNKMPLADFNKLSPSIHWNEVLQASGIASADTVVIGQPEFFSALETYLKSFSLDEWKNYLRWNLINSFAEYLNKDIDQQNFKFYHTVMSGQKEQKPRWKRVVEQTNASLGELIGQVYVNEYLPKGTKEKLLEIGNAIRSEYAERIKQLDWMSDDTKQKALSKLNKIIMKVGYPDKWKDMSNLSVDRSSYAANAMKANEWGFDYMIKKFGKPVDRTEWTMEPQTYNAYYNPTNNEIVVPACNIMVPGFEGRMPDDAVLYGVIGGSTFGHEITHGFDDQGSQYDENGNLRNWWTSADSARFFAKTKMIVNQFANYVVLDSMHINGRATQGENIADLGGVILGYEAFKKTPQGRSDEKISGLTPDQRYFLGYAYSWMVNMRPESIARQVKSDVHSPVKYRVIGPLSDVPEFYTAFNIKPGDEMYRADSLRVRIW